MFTGRPITTTAALAALCLTVSGHPASAASRIETTTVDCGTIRAALIREGAVILRYTSKKGLPIYDRYVRSSLLCQSHETGVWANVPARDTEACRVIACDANASTDDDLIRFRPLLRLTQ